LKSRKWEKTRGGGQPYRRCEIVKLRHRRPLLPLLIGPASTVLPMHMGIMLIKEEFHIAQTVEYECILMVI
jgi:hypothetical protein